LERRTAAGQVPPSSKRLCESLCCCDPAAGLGAAPRRTGCARDRPVSPRRARCAGGAGGHARNRPGASAGSGARTGSVGGREFWAPVCNHRHAQCRVEESVINGRRVTPPVRQLASASTIHSMPMHAKVRFGARGGDPRPDWPRSRSWSRLERGRTPVAARATARKVHLCEKEAGDEPEFERQRTSGVDRPLVAVPPPCRHRERKWSDVSHQGSVAANLPRDSARTVKLQPKVSSIGTSLAGRELARAGPRLPEPAPFEDSTSR
jgi:hypothetical protein